MDSCKTCVEKYCGLQWKFLWTVRRKFYQQLHGTSIDCCNLYGYFHRQGRKFHGQWWKFLRTVPWKIHGERWKLSGWKSHGKWSKSLISCLKVEWKVVGIPRTVVWRVRFHFQGGLCCSGHRFTDVSHLNLLWISSRGGRNLPSVRHVLCMHGTRRPSNMQQSRVFAAGETDSAEERKKINRSMSTRYPKGSLLARS